MLGVTTSSAGSVLTDFVSLAGDGLDTVEDGSCFQIVSTIQKSSASAILRMGKNPHES